MKNESKQFPLQHTLQDLQDALKEWDRISDAVPDELQEFRRKTQELLKQLSEQIKALDL